jgi:hypothetical protein
MPAGGDDGRKWWTVGAVSLVFLPLVIAFYGIVVALPAIGRDLHRSTTSLAWTVNAFMLGLYGLLAAGIGQGLAYNLSNTAALAPIAPEKAGVASGVLNTIRMVGLAVGVALTGVLVRALRV